MRNWKDLSYLEKGNESQILYFQILNNHRIIEILKEYDPVVAGTIPLEIDIHSSDLDIICNVRDFEQFKSVLIKEFGSCSCFSIKQKQLHGIDSLICRFYVVEKLIEIVGQNVPVEDQIAYRHMLIECEILDYFGQDFKNKIIELKKSGLKTEAAFASLLEIKGDPYQMLLNYKLKKS